MYALDNNSGVVVMPEIKSQSFSPDEPRWFTEGGNGTAPSYPGADWFNIVQGELLNVVKSAGVMPDKNALNQLSIAIQTMINATNTANVELRNILIGVPIPYPLAVVPSGCLAFNGQTFSTSLYPELAKKYPSGRLPDLRGEFIRGWDNGRNVDNGRELLSQQKASAQAFDPNITNVSAYSLVNRTGDAYANLSLDRVDWANYKDAIISYFAFGNTDTEGKALAETYYKLTKATGGTEDFWKMAAQYNSTRGWELGGSRPRNIALQYICLAA